MDDDFYDRYGIVLRTSFAAVQSEPIYNVLVWGWGNQRRIIERDGLISFQVTVHSDCCTCGQRVRFVKQQLADENVPCFWTYEAGSLYITVGPPPPQRPSAEMYLSFLLGVRVRVIRYSRPN